MLGILTADAVFMRFYRVLSCCCLSVMRMSESQSSVTSCGGEVIGEDYSTGACVFAI